MKTICILFAVASLAGCGLFRSIPSYQVIEVDGLVASNSVSIFNDSELREKTPSGLKFSTEFVVENTAGTESTLFLKKSYFSVNDTAIPTDCSSSQMAPDSAVSISPQQRIRIKCSALLKANAENQLARKDSTGHVVLPIGSLGFNRLSLAYRFRIEDFQ